MTDRQHNSQSNYDRGYDEGYNQARRRTGRSTRRGTLAVIVGALITVLLALLLLLVVFFGGIWLGSLVTDEPIDAPVAPVVPANAGADGDVTIVEGDTTVTIAGTGAATVPTPVGDYSIVVEPTTITIPTNGDLSKLSVRTGGVTIHH
ncbi:hypothetical protein [Haladaptatus salinisoli]|uniref:hypothetical protein n=1 Tax=Haladaptatus salinisoli TaxID=2884876 RepID=UPI001D0BB0FB|nr:hypothetical protein [Haladaptatus salinisoli]